MSACTCKAGELWTACKTDYHCPVHGESQGTCVWTEAYEGNGPWETGCGHDFELDYETPSENGMKFCCFCGKTLQEERWTEEPEEEAEPNCPLVTGLRPCQCDLPRCPECNYTEHDARFEGDHSGCPGEIPKEAEHGTPE